MKRLPTKIAKLCDALVIALTLFFISASYVTAQNSQAILPPGPDSDERFKVDVLLIVAHPDDEGMIGSYLARIAVDGKKRIAVIYGTRGNSGGNAVGYEQAASLGSIREIEARQALIFLGIDKVWFLDGNDTPGQDVLHSLETWKHGLALEQTVRLMRLTRPEIVMTWLPDYVVGENHGDHQAAGVIATEAFDLASDPASFPSQLAYPINHSMFGQTVEGLRPWQPKKLYYFTDAYHTDFTNGKGPQYPGGIVSPSRKVPYTHLAAQMTSFHLTQDDTGQLAKEAIAKKDIATLSKGELPRNSRSGPIHLRQITCPGRDHRRYF